MGGDPACRAGFVGYWGDARRRAVVLDRLGLKPVVPDAGALLSGRQLAAPA